MPAGAGRKLLKLLKKDTPPPPPPLTHKSNVEPVLKVHMKTPCMKSFRTAIETENFLMAASDVSMIAVFNI